MEDFNELTASEALFGFAGWLTVLKETNTAGGDHDCSIWGELVNQFCKANKLKNPREDWSTHLIHPSGEIAVAGRNKNINRENKGGEE